ncbi:SIMPL domain-containing protein [Alteromonas oceanisediminis]|uniref:SIMPL domain-containing protein n=1 Tax=Alteromonas oceanisediminis TaxID=2836180 RepID=UPI001BDB5C95|nr:SIMPL domain-containing protein [Alteromonas oceanisediminis]MBT0585551.1 SIMPL domain-containing protein [Alteromonas oceanisediminis]
MKQTPSLLFSIVILIAILGLGYQLSNAIVRFKTIDRNVVVKGLSEREYPADKVIWPIQFVEASNELSTLYAQMDATANAITAFLEEQGVAGDAISLSRPQITDKWANQYGGGPMPELRYTAAQTVTVYSEEVQHIRAVMGKISSLIKQGIALGGDAYYDQTEYLFTRLNDVKPDMIEEATKNAREVAQKFAQDSDSKLGQIRYASQGQFSVGSRDQNTPHIKKVRVVTTLNYYLVD